MKINKIHNKLELTNNGDLEIIFIGCGNAFDKTLYNNNIIIIKGNTHILVDFGFNAPYGLQKNTNLELYEIETILPTHSHTDHIGGIELLALTNRYFGIKKYNKNKLKMIITKEYKDTLWNYSLKGGLSFNEFNSYDDYLNFEDYFDEIEPVLIQSKKRKKYYIDFNDIRLEIFRTNHIPDLQKDVNGAFVSYGLWIDNKILFTGDTKFDKDLIEDYGDKAEYIFHDCSFNPNPVHCSLNELKTLDKKYKEKILLMHYSDDFDSYEYTDFFGLAKEGYRYIF